jgi:hypothetical protein
VKVSGRRPEHFCSRPVKADLILRGGTVADVCTGTLAEADTRVP